MDSHMTWAVDISDCYPLSSPPGTAVPSQPGGNRRQGSVPPPGGGGRDTTPNHFKLTEPSLGPKSTGRIFLGDIGTAAVLVLS